MVVTNLEVAQGTPLWPIGRVAEAAGIPEDALIPYGKVVAKVDGGFVGQLSGQPRGRLVLVTATTPTPAGEGKTTTSVGLVQALARLGHRAMVCLREPSLGPVFGVKGGATGGGRSQVLPMEAINLHFTGDLHAVTAAHNLLAAMVDNHLFHRRSPELDARQISWRRVVDMNDRALRQCVIGLGGKGDGVPRESGFDITASSEVMAILALARDLGDLKARIGRIVVGRTVDGKDVTAADLGAAGAMTVLLREALMPNLVQTVEHVPAFVHAGPFANIAHGASSVVATRAALGLADLVVTEAGFASDLGAEKFFDIVCRVGGFAPSAVVLVTTIRSLKWQGGADREALATEDLGALERGLPNLEAHLDNLVQFGVPVLVALNRFPTDTEAEQRTVFACLEARGVPGAVSDVFEQGGAGGEDLARRLLAILPKDPPPLRPRYPLEMGLAEKIDEVVRTVYGADGVDLDDRAARDVRDLEERGHGHLPICMAKTQLSLSDRPELRGRPRGFRVRVREVRVSAGAGFVVPICGPMMLMPGLPRQPAALQVDVASDGRITGLF
ncbi:MAG TPA: formate--tetrahydrofolate ligase [Myxococcota bacterium]|mgnify:CR=1 FL=1|nr:formate--tetrahydrofolate ligase [Myxococcota bacterium]HQK52324.1 formate--tetrahydrofolate ligase [Myxococcota bacterium]